MVFDATPKEGGVPKFGDPIKPRERPDRLGMRMPGDPAPKKNGNGKLDLKKLKDLPQLEPITVGDVTYIPAGKIRSAEQDMYFMDLVDQVGLDNLSEDQLWNSNLDKAARSLLLKAYRSGHLWLMLGTAMVEKGAETDWTPEVAEEVGEVFRRVTDPKARETLEKNMVVMIMDFFVSALSSSKSFQSFLESAKAAKTLGLTVSAKDAERTIFESGPQSSGNSPKATREGRKKSQGGQSGKRSLRTSKSSSETQ